MRLQWPPWRRPERSSRDGAPPEQVTLAAIGFVRSPVLRPRPRGWENVESIIAVRAEHAAKLRGLEGFSHLIVVFYLDLAPAAPHQPDTLTLASGTTYGIFATRSQLRPNHLGVSAVRLVRIDGNEVHVRGLDAIDGTPVLDIKPYLPEYDAHPTATVPGS